MSSPSCRTYAPQTDPKTISLSFEKRLSFLPCDRLLVTCSCQAASITRDIYTEASALLHLACRQASAAPLWRPLEEGPLWPPLSGKLLLFLQQPPSVFRARFLPARKGQLTFYPQLYSMPTTRPARNATLLSLYLIDAVRDRKDQAATEEEKRLFPLSTIVVVGCCCCQRKRTMAISGAFALE